MASPFQRYQSGGFEIPNIAQAGANIGQMYQRGMESFGESIGKGIQAYQAGIMQNQTADAKLAAAIRNTGMLAASLADHPDYQNIAGELAGKLEEYKKAPGKGLGAKLAAINDLETIGQTVTQSIQYQNLAAEARALQAYNETPETKMAEAHGVLAEHGYTPGSPASLEKAIKRLLSTVNKNNEEQKVGPGDVGYTDPQKALNELLGRARLGLKSAVAKDPKNPMLINAEAELEGAIKRFAAANDIKAAAAERDLVGLAKGVAGYFKGGVQQGMAVRAMEPEVDPMTLPYGAGGLDDTAREQIQLGGSADMTATPQERARARALENLTPEQRQQLAERDRQVDRLASTREGKALESYNSGKIASQGIDYMIQSLESGKMPKWREAAGTMYEPTRTEANMQAKVRDAQEVINRLETKSRTGAELDDKETKALEMARKVVEKGGAVDSSFYRDRISDAVTNRQVDMGAGAQIAPIWEKYTKRMEKLFDPYNPTINTPEGQAEAMRIKRELLAEKAKLTSNLKLEDVSRQATMEELYPESRFDEKPAETARLSITGNRAMEMQASPEERVALAKDALAKSEYVQRRFGGKIPAAALQALQSKILQPPQMVTDPATGARLYQSSPGRWEQLKVDKPEAGMTVNMPLFRPGDETITGGSQPQYNIRGTFKGGSEKERTAFVAQTQKRARALTSIDRLLEINEKTGESLRPELIGEAETIVNEIISSNRVDLIGPGQVAVAEWQMLEKLVRNPAKLVELDSVTRANLRRLAKRMRDVMYDEAYANGLELTPATSGAEVGRNMRVNNLLNRAQ